MRAALVAVLFTITAAAGCGASTCETYADKELACGGYPESERELTHKMAQGFCMAADAESPRTDFGQRITRKAACASRPDCAAYLACKQAIDDEPLRD